MNETQEQESASDEIDSLLADLPFDVLKGMSLLARAVQLNGSTAAIVDQLNLIAGRCETLMKGTKAAQRLPPMPFSLREKRAWEIFSVLIGTHAGASNVQAAHVAFEAVEAWGKVCIAKHALEAVSE